jgi:ribosomal protein L7/L12
MIAQTKEAVTRVERKLSALLKHSGLDIATIAGQEAQVLVRAGRKMEAIKLYREYTGVGLAEAKGAVERLQ